MMVGGGCSTVATTVAANKLQCDDRYAIPRIYSGVALDISFLRARREDSELLVVYDLPFSMVADTAILPYTIVTQAKYGNICK